MTTKLTDYQNNFLSDKAYNVDSRKTNNPIISGKLLTDKNNENFKVISVSDDKNTGFQGMAVAPITHGKPDYHNIQIAVAGTNFSDVKDVYTDATQIPEAQAVLNNFSSGTVDNHFNRSQFSSAERFYLKTVNKLEHKGFSASDIKHGTGHSLGGALMFYLAAKHHFPMTTFSSADPRSNLSLKEFGYIKNHPDMFKDYYHNSDFISNWQNLTHLGKAFPVSEFKSKNGQGLMSIINGHFLDSYHFDNGQVDANPIKSFEVALSSIQGEYNRLKGSGALTDADEIMLDAAAASALANSIRDEAETCLNDIIKDLKEASQKLEVYYKKMRKINYDMTPNLTMNEVDRELEKVGATFHNMVGRYKKEYEASIHRAERLKRSFNEWHNQTIQGIDKKISDDQELAKEFHL